MGGLVEGWVDGRVDGWEDGWKDGWVGLSLCNSRSDEVNLGSKLDSVQRLCEDRVGFRSSETPMAAQHCSFCCQFPPGCLSQLRVRLPLRPPLPRT